MKHTRTRDTAPTSTGGWTAEDGYGVLTETKLALKRIAAVTRPFWLIGILFLVIVAAFIFGADFGYRKQYPGYKSLQDSFPWWWWPAFIGLSLLAYSVSRLFVVAGLLLGTLMMLAPFLLLFATDLHRVVGMFSWPFWVLYFVGTGSLLFPAGMVGIDTALKTFRDRSKTRQGRETDRGTS